MKSNLKRTGYVLVALVAAMLAFYFWGSSGKLSREELNQVREWPVHRVAPADTLSIMTYNIGYLSGMTNNLAVDRTVDLYNGNQAKAIALFKKYQPDIIGIQEIDYGSSRSFDARQLDSIALGAGYGYAVQAVNWDKSYVPFPYWPPSQHFGAILSGQAIISKFEPEMAERKVLMQPVNAPFYYKAFYLERLVQIAQVNMGKPVVVINVHLEAFDQETREAQAEVLLQLTKEMAKDFPVILMGDFNAAPPYADNPEYQERTIQMFLDDPILGSAITEEQYLADPAAHFTYSSGAPEVMIDYIFYTKESIEVLDAKVVHEAGEISDHLPVMCRLRLR